MNPPTTPPPSQSGGTRVIVVPGSTSGGVPFHQHPASAFYSGTLDNERLPTRLQASVPDVADADLQVESGWWATGTLSANMPASSTWLAQTIRSDNSLGAFAVQVAYEIVGDLRVYRRALQVVAWTDWTRVDGPEETTLAAAGVFAGSVTLRKVAGIVYADGSISRASSSSTTYTDCTGAIPAAFRPGADTELVGGTVFNTAVTHQFKALAAGGFQVRMSGATANAMAVNGHWAV